MEVDEVQWDRTALDVKGWVKLGDEELVDVDGFGFNINTVLCCMQVKPCAFYTPEQQNIWESRL